MLKEIIKKIKKCPLQNTYQLESISQKKKVIYSETPTRLILVENLLTK